MRRRFEVNLVQRVPASYTPPMNDASDTRLQEAALRPDVDPLRPGPSYARARWIAVVVGALLGLIFV